LAWCTEISFHDTQGWASPHHEDKIAVGRLIVAVPVVVVAVDANANGPVDSFVGSKNYDAGVMACDYLAKAIGDKGEVAILDGIPVVPILERVRGCKAALPK
jgi:ABC-type sugar transport system substrate-binding protein